MSPTRRIFYNKLARSRHVADDNESERQPLVQPSSSSSSTPRAASLLRQPASPSPSSHNSPLLAPRPSHDSNYDVQYGDIQPDSRPNTPGLGAVMEKVKSSRVAHYAGKLAVESEPGLTNTQLMLTNHDLKPVEPERRQWRSWNFVGFWVADSFNINTWMIASSTITNGCSWWQAWICVWIGYAIAACFICLTGRIGAMYHIGFPVVNRASFGIWGSLWPVFNRAAMACVWYGVQSWIGGQCVQLMIRSIWNNWREGVVPNGIKSSGTSTVMFVSFFLFWLGSLPAIWFPVHKIRHLFTVKAYVVPVAGLAFFIWFIVKAGGVGPIVHQPAQLKGSALAWEIVKGIMSSIANFATLIVNDPDFSRFAKTPKSAFWSQLITIPVGFAVTSFIGIIVSSSATIIYPGQEPIWNPLDLLTRVLDEENTSANRFGVFCIAAAFTLAQLGTNIAANSVSAGTDMTALLPRWINIRRGGYICAVVGLCMCPWNLLSSSNNFTTYLSAYSVFLSSIAGVMISDYYWVRRGYLDIHQLYSGRRSGVYFFTLGFHWRGYAAYIAGILINVVGFAGAIGREVPIGATYIYNVNFFAGFLVSSIMYWGLCRLFPIPATSDTWMEVGDEITDVRLAYDDRASDAYDEEVVTGGAKGVSSSSGAEQESAKDGLKL
ncbi:putative uracil permease protein [Lasiodiplodia theobromae]|uniref:Uracil permease n=1 Tax=Lasiodiplodia theobromae TaxID=45133 RepID=A0A5N5DH90_9PEZI|nr:Uracil permease protein [Lasiodiplodia theobromae]KAB2576344.1 Uracil permease [Lasiodiplodia theobromae]KAF4543989.1 Uracil permease protein [Lasiodiplodia theobromae]KAF9629237.1 putative uracil permease protein [Lasiodiplodia theobromae]